MSWSFCGGDLFFYFLLFGSLKEKNPSSCRFVPWIVFVKRINWPAVRLFINRGRESVKKKGLGSFCLVKKASHGRI